MKYKVWGILSSSTSGLLFCSYSIVVSHLSPVIANEGRNLREYSVSDWIPKKTKQVAKDYCET